MAWPGQARDDRPSFVAGDAAFSVKVSCVLSEDYALTAPASLGGAGDGVAAFVLADGTAEAAVLLCGTLYHLHADATAAGGWSLTPIPDAEGVLDMVAGLNPGDQLVRLFYRTASGVTILALGSGGSWQAEETLNWQFPLQAVFDAGGDFFVYGYDRQAGTVSYYQVNTIPGPGNPQTGTFTGMPFSAVGDIGLTWAGFFWPMACDNTGAVHFWKLPQNEQAAITDACETQVISLPQGTQANGVVCAYGNESPFPVVQDAESSLWTVTLATNTQKIWDCLDLGLG